MADWLLALGKAFEPPAVDQENVNPVILVVVEEGCAAAGGFEQVFVAVFTAEDLSTLSPACLATSTNCTPSGVPVTGEGAPLGAGRASAE